MAILSQCVCKQSLLPLVCRAFPVCLRNLLTCKLVLEVRNVRGIREVVQSHFLCAKAGCSTPLC